MVVVADGTFPFAAICDRSLLADDKTSHVLSSIQVDLRRTFSDSASLLNSTLTARIGKIAVPASDNESCSQRDAMPILVCGGVDRQLLHFDAMAWHL